MEVEVEAAAATCSPRLDCLLAFSSLSSALPAIATDLIGVKVRRTTQTYDTVVVGTVLTARGFYFTFQNYEWESEVNSQTIVVKLSNPIFEAEFHRQHIRTAIAQAQQITPEVVRAVFNSLQN